MGLTMCPGQVTCGTQKETRDRPGALGFFGVDTYILQGVLVGGWQGRELGLRVVGRKALPQHAQLSRARLLPREGERLGVSHQGPATLG